MSTNPLRKRSEFIYCGFSICLVSSLLSCSERDEDSIRVLTEHCRNIHICELLHDTPDESIGCYVVRACRSVEHRMSFVL